MLGTMKERDRNEHAQETRYLCISRGGAGEHLGPAVGDIIRAAVENGFTCLQIRSKTASARELIALCREAADVLRELGKAEDVVLLVDDRLDVVLAARDVASRSMASTSARVISPSQSAASSWDLRRSSACRRARRSCSTTSVRLTRGHRLLWRRPVARDGNEARLRPRCRRHIITRSFEELTELHAISPVPVVVGGGVKAHDLPALRKTGVDGFFVVSAVAGAEEPRPPRANSWRPGRLHRVRDIRREHDGNIERRVPFMALVFFFGRAYDKMNEMRRDV